MSLQPPPAIETAPRPTQPPPLACGGQGLTLIHVSAYLEPFLTQMIPPDSP
jgi:hypothetical protein